MGANEMRIILAAVLGGLVLALTVVLTLLFWKRSSRRRLRTFSLRAATPLDDAEFESWRRPSQQTRRQEMYGIKPTQPAVIRNARLPNMMEKELAYEDHPRTPSSPKEKRSPSPFSPVRKPGRVRRKSSGCSSIADRPPTPYSPASTSGEYPRSSFTPGRSTGGGPRTHYPSLSEASSFNFDFSPDYDSQSKYATRRPSQSELPLNLSYRYDSYSDPV